MKSNKFCLLFYLFIFQVQTILRTETRLELLNLLTEKISKSDSEKDFNEKLFDKYFESDSFQKMTYNIAEIKLLMDQYDLPENFNYLTETKAKIEVKDQGSCGCCWACSGASSLAYRYKKYGVDISLSAQDALSCYIPDCDEGNYVTDSLLNYVNNGSLTEGCFPFVSTDGKTIPKCPSECKDGSEFKKYYSQNAYVSKNNNQELFYSLVILLMDQLVTQGPFIAGFSVYQDFYDFAYSTQKCQNDVYTYNGRSTYRGQHAITVVGYGILNNKIYWLVQNSWGPNWCDNGFIKMEIGQFFEIGFFEPNIMPDQITPTEIPVYLTNQNNDCNLLVESPSLDEWNNTLKVSFKNEEKSEDFYFFIGSNKLSRVDKISCYYEILPAYYFKKKGLYTYNDFESLGNVNTFTLSSFENFTFNYYGYDLIDYTIVNNYYVSQEGSKIVFDHVLDANDDTLPPIFMDNYGIVPLSKCSHLKASDGFSYSFGYCEITQDELNYIEQKGRVRLYYNILCGTLLSTYIYVNKLDTTKGKVFKIIKFIKPKVSKITSSTDLVLFSTVTGGGNIYQNEDFLFYTMMDIENNNKNTTVMNKCSLQINTGTKETNLICHLYGYQNYQFQNIYLLPYSIPSSCSRNFEVNINTTIKAEEEPEPGPTDPTDSTQPGPTDSTEPGPTDSSGPVPDTTDPFPTDENIYPSYSRYWLSLLFELILLVF